MINITFDRNIWLTELLRLKKQYFKPFNSACFIVEVDNNTDV